MLGKVSLIFGPGTADPVNGYRDISGDQHLFNITTYRYGTDRSTDGFQHYANAGTINLEMGGGTPCWHFLTSYGWYFWLPFAAIFLQQQARWLNHGMPCAHYLLSLPLILFIVGQASSILAAMWWSLARL